MDLVTDPAVRKLMHTIVSNVLTHPDELSKYGRINLAGKAGAKLTAQPGSVEALTALGFAASEDGHLVLAPENVDAAALTSAQAQLAPAAAAAAAPAPVSMDTDEDGQPLSLKQQARRAKELAEKRARDAAKAQREATVKQIKTDKMVREKDENWTTTNGVTKGGKDVGTFRDKFGEDQGG